jgi:glucose/mannose transport system substrate-binding protein
MRKIAINPMTTCLALAMATTACTSDRSEPIFLSVFKWWTEPGEADAMDNLQATFERKHQNIFIRGPVAGGSDAARATLSDKLRAGAPPDTFQANGGWDLFRWVMFNNVDDNASKLLPLDNLARSEKWDQKYPGLILDTVRYYNENGVTTYAVPLDVHRVNVLFYNKRVFDEAGVPHPTREDTLETLFGLADKLAEHARDTGNGRTAFAVGMDKPWTLALTLFENILVAQAQGPSHYLDLFCGRIANPVRDDGLRAALDTLHRLLTTPGYTNADANKLSWSQAVELVRTERAAMTIMGDWAKGYLWAQGPRPPDKLFGVVPMPGTNGTFVFTTDTFGLPKGAPNSSATLQLLRFLGSKDGQQAFNPLKGSTAPRLDAQTIVDDDVAQRTLDDFRAVMDDGTKLVPANALLAHPDFMAAVSTALGQFADPSEPDLFGNVSHVLYTIQNRYDMLPVSDLGLGVRRFCSPSP